MEATSIIIYFSIYVLIYFGTCALRIVSRDKILRFKNTFIIIITSIPKTGSENSTFLTETLWNSPMQSGSCVFTQMRRLIRGYAVRGH